jgi:hypothetical protein
LERAVEHDHVVGIYTEPATFCAHGLCDFERFWAAFEGEPRKGRSPTALPSHRLFVTGGCWVSCWSRTISASRSPLLSRHHRPAPFPPTPDHRTFSPPSASARLPALGHISPARSWHFSALSSQPRSSPRPSGPLRPATRTRIRSSWLRWRVARTPRAKGSLTGRRGPGRAGPRRSERRR